MINTICKLYVRSFTWDSGVSFLPPIKEIVVIRNTILKPKSKRGLRRMKRKSA